MKLKPVDNYRDFLNVVEQCQGKVYFVTPDGDRLNLKSTFCQYMFASVCADRAYMEKADVECSDFEDYLILGEYLKPGNLLDDLDDTDL